MSTTNLRTTRSIAPLLAIVCVAMGLAALPLFHPPLFFESFLYLAFFWIALATSWSILSGFSGYISFGHGAFYGVGVYTMADLGSILPLWATLLAAGGFASLLGVAIGAVSFRVRRLRGELFALLTLALAIIVSTVVLNTPIDGGPGVMLSGPSLPRIYANRSSTIYLMGLCVAFGSMATAWWIQGSRLGRGLFAISDDEDVAEILGVPTFRMKLIAIGVSSGFAGLMGAVHAIFVNYVTVGETFSITVPLYVLLMSVLGGSRYWLGPALGAIFITAISYSFVGGDFALIARASIGFTLVLATLFLPAGAMGLMASLRRSGGSKPPEHTVLPSASIPADAEPPVPVRNTSRPLVEARGISLAFRGVQALDDVSFHIREGEILGLVGPNGSGKSTLINVIGGFYMPDAGLLQFEGRDITRASGHARAGLGIARTFQIPRPFARLTVFENVMVSATFGADALPHRAAVSRAMEALEFVGLSGRLSAAPQDLNLHQRKFLELARVLASGARLVMLDEVLAGLTPREISTAIDMVRRIHTRGATILFVEHNMRAVLELADRLIVLNQGRLISSGEPREVVKDPEVVSAYLGAPRASH